MPSEAHVVPSRLVALEEAHGVPFASPRQAAPEARVTWLGRTWYWFGRGASGSLSALPSAPLRPSPPANAGTSSCPIPHKVPGTSTRYLRVQGRALTTARLVLECDLWQRAFVACLCNKTLRRGIICMRKHSAQSRTSLIIRGAQSQRLLLVNKLFCLGYQN